MLSDDLVSAPSPFTVITSADDSYGRLGNYAS